MITEIGKDVKPAYTNSKIHADRLKRSKIWLVIGAHRGMTRFGRDYNTKPQWLYCNRCQCPLKYQNIEILIQVIVLYYNDWTTPPVLLGYNLFIDNTGHCVK